MCNNTYQREHGGVGSNRALGGGGGGGGGTNKGCGCGFDYWIL